MSNRASLLMQDPSRVPAGRYFDKDFFDLEVEKLWRRAWQPACHLDEIPNVGDFREYRILDQSFLIVREGEGDDGIRAMRNACRHRGVALGLGSGSFENKQITCPFHGWRYNLNGTISYVFGSKHFPRECLTREDLSLPPINVGVKYGFVWINPDPEGVPFADAFRGVEHALDPTRLDLMHVDWWHRVEMEGNWKVAQEAFMESFHQMQTHPEIVSFKRDGDINYEVGATYDTDDQGHGWLSGVRGDDQPDSSFVEYVKGQHPAQFMITTQRVMYEGAKTIITDWQVAIQDRLIAEGVADDDFLPAYMSAVFAEAAERKIPIPQPTLEATSHATVFPNFTLVVGQGTALIYRSRPLTPNRCEYDIWSMSMRPEGEEIPRAVEGMGAPWEDHWFVHQDVSNIERAQVGLKSDGYGATRISPSIEAMISNWHLALDRKLTA